MQKKIVVLGTGRIAQALKSFLSLDHEVITTEDLEQAEFADLLIGTLPGSIGQNGLKLSLKYRKDFLDISDVDPPFYLRHKEKINRAGILVIPNCGFSPGLINFILGREFVNSGITDVEIMAGSLSPKKGYFPFLWCFEDLILCQNLKSWQLIQNKHVYLPAQAGLREEKIFGIEAESFFSASGFEQLMKHKGLHNFTYRVVRPRGFVNFFNRLKKESAFSKKNIAQTKKLLEAKKEDNLTFAIIKILRGQVRKTWQLKSFSKKNEILNSMQKITVGLPILLTKLIFKNKIRQRALIFPEELGTDEFIFRYVIKKIKDYGVEVKRYA